MTANLQRRLFIILNAFGQPLKPLHRRDKKPGQRDPSSSGGDATASAGTLQYRCDLKIAVARIVEHCLRKNRAEGGRCGCEQAAIGNCS